MITIHICNDLEQARHLWQRHWPRECLFDLWPVRFCFQNQFDREPCFLVARRGETVCGLLALSWIEETQEYGHFPGEIWQGKTWLEQNKILADDAETFEALIDAFPGPTRIRYLTASPYLDRSAGAVDEIGYRFLPAAHNHSFSTFMQSFSGKSRKKIRRELEILASGGVTYRHDHFADIDLLFRLNLEAFQEKSYFNDARFLAAFENLAAWLHANKLLRLTTLIIAGRVAAVDMGAVFQNTYTVLAGGTDPGFPGVAKMINLHHLEWACEQQVAEVDFLCGDFNWKQRFHLDPRPLYLLSGRRQALLPDTAIHRRVACAQ